jgi:dimethylglycine dehydrogenase
VPGKRGYWCACAVMAGFLQGGGVGKSLAEWMIHGEPEADAWAWMWPATALGREQAIHQGDHRPVLFPPLRDDLSERAAARGRPLKMAPRMTHDRGGLPLGQSWDLEVPLYFAPEGFEETPTLKRSNAFDDRGRGMPACARRGPARYHRLLALRGLGPNAEGWLDRLMASRCPKPGRARLAPMLAPDGRLKGDLTCSTGATAPGGSWAVLLPARLAHALVQRPHGTASPVRDLGEEVCGFSLSGPKSRKVIERLTDGPWATCPSWAAARSTSAGPGQGRADVGAGELGYEINCRAGDHIALRRMLLEAGADHGIRESASTRCCRCGWRKASASGRPNSPKATRRAMTGMDRWIAWDKGDFIGRDAALAERDGNGPGARNW